MAAPTLHTARLTLRPTDPDADAEPLLAMYRGGPQTDPWEFETAHRQRMTTARMHRTLEQTVRAAQGWAWTVLEAGRPVGVFNLFPGEGQEQRGVSYRLAPSEWGRGYMSEAVRAGSDCLLTDGGFHRLEAWVDSRNHRSLGVARAAGYAERGRLPCVYLDHIGQTIVLGRAAQDTDPPVFDLSPVLVVRDVPDTVRRLGELLDLRVTFEADGYAQLNPTGWSGSPGLVVRRGEPTAPTTVSVEVALHVDRLVRRARRLDFAVVRPPVEQPWFRRDMTVQTPEGHLLEISGPSTPEGWARRLRTADAAG